MNKLPLYEKGAPVKKFKLMLKQHLENRPDCCPPLYQKENK